MHEKRWILKQKNDLSIRIAQPSAHWKKNKRKTEQIKYLAIINKGEESCHPRVETTVMDPGRLSGVDAS